MLRKHVAMSAAACALVLGTVASAHETDQHTVPRGKDFAEIGDYITAIYYDGISAGVRIANERIRRGEQAERGPSYLEHLRSPEAVTDAIYHEYAAALFMIEGVERHIHKNPETMLEHPGRITGYWESIHNMFTGVYFPLDPRQLFRIWHSCSMKAYGVHFGPDKLGHFTDMGYVYYTIWRDAIADGATETQAHARVMAEGKRGLILGEEGMLGYLSAGVYSNADLSSNFAGMKFYLNVTTPVRIRGEMRPPLVVWNGERWEVSPHVQRDSDFFSWFVSDHWNEAFNPGLFVPGMRDKVRENVRKRAESILDFYLDDNGNRRTKSWFDARHAELTTWYGEEYGHQGSPDELVTIGNTCFEVPQSDDDPMARNRSGHTQLHWGAMTGLRAAILSALDSGVDVDEPVQSLAQSSAEWGSTALHLAAAEGQVDMVALLIERGADVNRRNLRSVTPLHNGCTHPEVVQLLLAHGAEIGATDEQGRTPLHWLARYPDGASLRMLLTAGANVLARDRTGATPLHRAARAGNLEAMRTLLEAGAAAGATARFRTTPLHFAARQDDSAVVRLLVDFGADPNDRDEFGLSPLHAAARAGRVELTRALLSSGADADLADHYGSTALHLAAREGHEGVLRVLLAGGCEVNRANSFGTYPLHEAVFADRLNSIHLLLEHGADTTARNGQGQSPIEMASDKGQSLAVLRMSAAEAAAQANLRTMGLN